MLIVRVRVAEPADPAVVKKRMRIVCLPLVTFLFIQENVRTFDAPVLLVESKPTGVTGLIPVGESSTSTWTPATDPTGTLLNWDDNSMRSVQLPRHPTSVGV